MEIAINREYITIKSKKFFGILCKYYRRFECIEYAVISQQTLLQYSTIEKKFKNLYSDRPRYYIFNL